MRKKNSDPLEESEKGATHQTSRTAMAMCVGDCLFDMSQRIGARASHVRPIRNSNLEIFGCENKGHVAPPHSDQMMFWSLLSGLEQCSVPMGTKMWFKKDKGLVLHTNRLMLQSHTNKFGNVSTRAPLIVVVDTAHLQVQTL